MAAQAREQIQTVVNGQKGIDGFDKFKRENIGYSDRFREKKSRMMKFLGSMPW